MSQEESVSELRFSRDAVWLVTGGLSGFGMEAARWLAERGVGRLILVGRRGAQTPGAAQFIEALAMLGARAEAMSCDVSDTVAVRTLLARIHDDSKPLTGILHASMVLDDALIANLDAKRVRQVLGPKLQGARNLHELTRQTPLQYFVLFSSIATFVGNPGQASYVAANAAVESLAALRRSLGLPVTCIAWGAIGDVGYLARNERVKSAIAARLGAALLRAHDLLPAMDHLLVDSAPVTGVANLDWQAMQALPSSEVSRFDGIRLSAGGVAPGEAGRDVVFLISGKSRGDATDIVRALVSEAVAKVLLVKPERIDPLRSLYDLGMDSLMGMELVMSMERQFGLQIPPMMLVERPSVEQVTQYMVDRLFKAGTHAANVDGDDENMLAVLAKQHGVAASMDDVRQIIELMNIASDAKSAAKSS